MLPPTHGSYEKSRVFRVFSGPFLWKLLPTEDTEVTKEDEFIRRVDLLGSE
jgi:hypothetical protein